MSRKLSPHMQKFKEMELARKEGTLPPMPKGGVLQTGMPEHMKRYREIMNFGEIRQAPASYKDLGEYGLRESSKFGYNMLAGLSKASPDAMMAQTGNVILKALGIDKQIPTVGGVVGDWLEKQGKIHGPSEVQEKLVSKEFPTLKHVAKGVGQAPYYMMAGHAAGPLSMAGQGALMGGMGGAVESTGEPLPERMKKTALGTALGALTGWGMGKLMPTKSQQESIAAMKALHKQGVHRGDSVNKVMSLLDDAQALRKQQSAMTHAERAKRAAALAKVQAGEVTEDIIEREAAALKGKMPKVDYKGIGKHLNEDDIVDLFYKVNRDPNLSPYDKWDAKQGLKKLFNGELPTDTEIQMISKVFSPEFAKKILSSREILPRIVDAASDVISIPRAMMTSGDLSAPFRQGAFLLAGHPIKGLKAIKDMVKFAFSEKSFIKYMQGVRKSPTYDTMKAAGLEITDLGHVMTGREESFMSKLAGKIPIAGMLVRGSNRAHTGFLNRMRVDVFNSMLSDAKRLGFNVTPGSDITKNFAHFINVASGRGSLGSLEGSAAKVLNATLFSPRLLASRFQMISQGAKALTPGKFTKLDPITRKEIIRDIGAFVGLGSTILGLAKAAGWEIGKEDTSADFMKAKKGTTRIDPWAGVQQLYVLMRRIRKQKTTSSTTGVEREFGEGYDPPNTLKMIQQFLSSKLAPVGSYAIGLATGEDFLGQDFKPGEEAIKRLTPMAWQDIYEAQKDLGPKEGIPVGSLGMVGVGVQTYGATAEHMVRGYNTVTRKIKEYKKYKRPLDAQNLKNQNRQILKIGEALKPIQTEIDEIEKEIKDIERTVGIHEVHKKALIKKKEAKRKAKILKRDAKFEILKKKYKSLSN